MKTKIEQHYQSYLKTVKLDESKMPQSQINTLRDTYFGAWGQALIALRDDVGELPENEAMDMMQSFLDQVGEYFNDRVK